MTLIASAIYFFLTIYATAKIIDKCSLPFFVILFCVTNIVILLRCFPSCYISALNFDFKVEVESSTYEQDTPQEKASLKHILNL